MKLLTAAAVICALMHEQMLPAVAAEQTDAGMHLIQTVTDRDIYEGLVVLGMLETPLTELEDLGESYEAVKGCVVRIEMEHAYGSGLIWQLGIHEILIVSNRHVLDFWQDDTGTVCFAQGCRAQAELIGCSEDYDVGFLQINTGQLPAELLCRLRQVNTAWSIRSDGNTADRTAYKPYPGQRVMHVGSGAEQGSLFAYEAVIEDLALYIPDFEEDMIYCRGAACEGMSGGGTFDGWGHFIGMLSGGTDEEETVSIPEEAMWKAYAEVTGDGIPLT